MSLPLRLRWGCWFERVQDDGVADGADGAVAVVSAGVAVRAAALAGAGGGAP
jgi:hypothetical protein